MFLESVPGSRFHISTSWRYVGSICAASLGLPLKRHHLYSAPWNIRSPGRPNARHLRECPAHGCPARDAFPPVANPGLTTAASKCDPGSRDLFWTTLLAFWRHLHSDSG